MRKKQRQILLLSLGAILLIAVTAGASTYLLTQDDKPAVKAESRAQNAIQWDQGTQASAAPPPQPRCDDGNIVGKVVGGVGGGAAASSVGKGKGKTAATIAGTLGGAYLGGEYLPTRNVTCRN